MATTEMHAYHDSKYIWEKNDYISDGHGIEPLIRANRYLQNANYLMPETRGYNVPEDPHIAARIMELAQKEYEYNIGHKDEINRSNGARSVYLYQLFISFHNLEWMSPQQRHEMVARLVEEMIRRGCLIRIVEHNNTWCRHIHIIVCAYEPDGHHKVRISLADLRRIMDRICADYGLSIIDTAYLRRDEEYAKWFYLIVEMGEIVIHPPKARETNHETREESPQSKQWKKPEHPAWAPQTAGRYHYLPPWIPPWNVADESMYCPAMDMDNPLWGWGLSVRHAPLYLLLTAAQKRAQACEEALLLRGKRKDHKRIERVQRLSRLCAGGVELISQVDVGTMADIDCHIACAQADIQRRRSHQKELIKELVRTRLEAHMNQEKLARIRKRQVNNDQWILDLRHECRRLEQLKRLCRMLHDPDVWADYDDVIASHNRPGEKRIPRKPYIRRELRYISQLVGADPAAVEEELWSVVERGKPAVVKRCAAVIPEVTIGIAQAMADVAQLCTTITDPYAEHDRIDAVRKQLQEQMDSGALLRGVMALDTALLRYEEGFERNRIALGVRSAVEDIHWHLQNALYQLTTTQSVSTLRTAYGELALAMTEWQRILEAEMPRLEQHTDISLNAFLRRLPGPDYTLALDEQVTFDFVAELDQYRARVKRARDKLDRSIVRHYGPDPMLGRGRGQKLPEKEPDPHETEPDVSEKEQKVEPSRPPLAGMVVNARDRSKQGKLKGQNGRGRPEDALPR